MAFCIGIAGRDQSAGVAESGFQFSVYPKSRSGKERIGGPEETVTHLDMAAPGCISLHNVLWHAGPISPCLRRRGDSTVPASKRAGPRKTGSLASCPDLGIVATAVVSPACPPARVAVPTLGIVHQCALSGLISTGTIDSASSKIRSAAAIAALCRPVR